eukprot:1503409-Prymnesium_polylepis.2
MPTEVARVVMESTQELYDGLDHAVSPSAHTITRPDDLWLPGYFNELPDTLVERIMDDYTYGLRFRMCMSEINKISQWVEYQEGPGFQRNDAIYKWGRSTVYVKGPGFA